MSDSLYTSDFASYTTDFGNQDFGKQGSLEANLDFSSFQSPSDVLAPHPDLFELELDDSLAAYNEFDLQLFTVDSHDAFTHWRSDTPTRGPPSILSESAYSSNYSDSFYNPNPPSPNFSFPYDDMNFGRMRMDSMSDFGSTHSNPLDPNSFGTLPPTPPRSPELVAANNAKTFPARGSYSDYGAPTRLVPSSASSDYYSQSNSYRARNLMQPSTVSPSNVSPQAPSSPPLSDESDDRDPTKKYKCTACPRAFARAYNLKTHMATHDPNRPKPHSCPHRSCGRSFSRKHDLGRHLVSIHRDDSVCSSQLSSSIKKPIGVEKGVRSWCESCGKGYVGKERDCKCQDVK